MTFFSLSEISRKICDYLREDLFCLENTRPLCPWSLALSISVLGFEKVCIRKVGRWPRIFLWPWPRASCPRLHLLLVA